ncbi:MAG: thioesterase domain-containing protein [Planctomycetota bacterium]
MERSPDPSGPRARAQAARAAGRRTLVVAFEGLWSYRGSYTRALLRYQDRRRRGAAARPPTAPPLSSYVSQRLIAPLLAEGGPDVALFSETSETADASEALDTVLAWRQVLGSELRLVVVGHSFGGLAALRLARKLGARGVEVQHLLTLDPRAPTAAGYREFVTPSGVREHHTYYQRGWWLPGRPIEGSQNHRLQGVGHTAVPGAPEVRARFQAMLGD